ncbi:MAG TPA: hypothetical protein VF618_15095 [Thermoanaerobaculia bacterium]
MIYRITIDGLEIRRVFHVRRKYNPMTIRDEGEPVALFPGGMEFPVQPVSGD